MAFTAFPPKPPSGGNDLGYALADIESGTAVRLNLHFIATPEEGGVVPSSGGESSYAYVA